MSPIKTVGYLLWLLPVINLSIRKMAKCVISNATEIPMKHPRIGLFISCRQVTVHSSHFLLSDVNFPAQRRRYGKWLEKVLPQHTTQLICILQFARNKQVVYKHRSTRRFFLRFCCVDYLLLFAIYSFLRDFNQSLCRGKQTECLINKKKKFWLFHIRQFTYYPFRFFILL